MRRSMLTMTILMVGLIALFVNNLALADDLALGTSFCDGKASPATGEGSLGQVALHADVFAPAFSSGCPLEGGLVSYLGTGDQSGITALTARGRAFAGSDVPLTSVQKAQLEVAFGRYSQVHQVPLYIDGLAIAYNIPCSGPAINFKSQILSLIYSGVVTRWNDPLLVNTPGNNWLATCNETIQLTKRSDLGSGATTVFQDYLSKRTPYWSAFKYSSGAAQWPTQTFGCSGLGDSGMVNCITSHRGAIGYLRMAVASGNGLKVGNIENVTQSLVAPSSSGCASAADSAVTPPGLGSNSVPGLQLPSFYPATLGDWSAVSMTDAPDGLGTHSYPICFFSYAFVLQGWNSGYGGTVGVTVERSVYDYFTIALADSTQAALSSHGVAPLPQKLLQIGRDGIKSMSFYNITSTGLI
ncbi:MAG: substrate-binding domain-containing protein [Actinomycetota bacterium]|nr:substrate-binding domain-containing protein [Actinomycetota bacterium]